MKKGVVASPGFAIGKAFLMRPVVVAAEARQVAEGADAGEIGQLNKACSAAAQDLDALIVRVAQQVGEGEADIFRAHQALLKDPTLVEKVKGIIRERRVDAPTALREVLDEYSTTLGRSRDEHLKERLADLQDVIGRIAARLAPEKERSPVAGEEPVIVIAAELLPSQVAEFERRKVAGIVTERGGATGHAAILARAMGIPMVTGVANLLRDVRAGDVVAVDGREGQVYLNPGPEVRADEERLRTARVGLQDALAADPRKECLTADGVRVELLANVSGPADAALGARLGAAGVGLYRTEYLFLTHASIPSEDEQRAAYREVIDAAPNRRAVIRTIDLGEDKYLPLLGAPPEGNPALGWRGVRLNLAYPELLETQLRAILRAGCDGEVSLLFPMVTARDEVQRLKALVAEARQTLQQRGTAATGRLPFGVMVEVPAAALCIEDLLDEVDFVSIGTNDLIQYLVAADRHSPRMAPLCEPFSPALYRLLAAVVKTCADRGKPVTLCGEMASRPVCFLPLLGMGLRSLSMSPIFIPTIRELIRHATLVKAKEVLAHVLGLKTAHEIRRYLEDVVKAVWPAAALLDVREAPDESQAALPSVRGLSPLRPPGASSLSTKSRS
jgi:phosphotransferase system enzyme I (PtsI)